MSHQSRVVDSSLVTWMIFESPVKGQVQVRQPLGLKRIFCWVCPANCSTVAWTSDSLWYMCSCLFLFKVSCLLRQDISIGIPRNMLIPRTLCQTNPKFFRLAFWQPLPPEPQDPCLYDTGGRQGASEKGMPTCLALQDSRGSWVLKSL